jgi:16S rRNA (cytosine1402-N4)-methyltransferase
MSSYHIPVLLNEAVDYLNVVPGAKYIDATLGGGGHAVAIKAKGGRVLGLDQDPEAIENSRNLVDVAVKTNFTHLEETARQHNWLPAVGVLLDLGVSMHQFKQARRGFSFQYDGPLDMRMGNTAVTAAVLVNQLPVEQLASILKDFGEIPTAKALAQKIVSVRPLTTTSQLTQVCDKWSQQAFQALRIAVNDELGALGEVIPQIKNVLAPGGRAVIISFHSLEDRIVKNQFKNWGIALTKKPVEGERGSKLRAYQKI